MTEELSHEDVTAVVDRFVQELLGGAGVAEPPVDCIKLAQGHLGMVICLDTRQQQRGRAQRAAGRKQIYLRPEPTEERHQWTVAHEIGEHLKTKLLERLDVQADQTQSMTGESLANLFAHRLLVPRIWYAADAPALDYDLLALKNRYATASHEVLALRMLDLPDPCIITIVDNDHIHKRRSNARRVRKALEPVEEKCRLYVNKHGRPHVVRANGWTVHGWPVHQADWKREILRSVVDEESG
jgi:Zn-dependent peptidase ImmA (M78 family)